MLADCGNVASSKVWGCLNVKIKVNKFALLWGEAQLCLPYVFL